MTQHVNRVSIASPLQADETVSKIEPYTDLQFNQMIGSSFSKYITNLKGDGETLTDMLGRITRDPSNLSELLNFSATSMDYINQLQLLSTSCRKITGACETVLKGS